LPLVAFASICGEAPAATDQYDYDPLGRLIRWVAPNGQVTEYVYDAAGNILSVTQAGAVQPPSVSGISPTFLRRSATTSVTLTGSGFLGASLTTTMPGVTISGVTIQNSEFKFSATVAQEVPIGAAPFQLKNSLGVVAFSLNVQPALPKIDLTPKPISLVNSGAAGQYTLTLSNADLIAHGLSVSMDDPSVATVTPASSTIAAGQTTLNLSLAGLKTGTTTLRIESATLGATLFPIFVGPPVTGSLRVGSRAVAVVLGTEPPTPVQPKPIGPVRGGPVSVVIPVTDPPVVNTSSGPLVSRSVGVLLQGEVTPSTPIPVAPVISRPVGVVAP